MNSRIERIFSSCQWLWLALILFTLTQGCGNKQPKIEPNSPLALPLVNHNKYTGCTTDGGCHSLDRPVPNQDLVAVPHGFGQDCVNCHAFANHWAPIEYSHIPAPTACLGCHSVKRNGATHMALGECARCHTNPVWKNTKAAGLIFSKEWFKNL